MDVQRAQEIASMTEMCHVTCNGEQIYIEHVDQDNGMATIHPLNDPTKKQSVSITDLQER